MITARETIYATLFAKWQAVLGPLGSNIIQSFTRSPQVYANFGTDNTPALLQVQRREIAEKRVANLPVLWKIQLEVLIYFITGGDPSTIQVQQMNPVLDAIEAVLAPDPVGQWSNWLGLDGIVYASIQGEVKIIEGLESQAEILVPIEIMAL